MNRELATFFNLMFAIDTDHGDLDTISFPTFEEVLGAFASRHLGSFRQSRDKFSFAVIPPAQGVADLVLYDKIQVNE